MENFPGPDQNNPLSGMEAIKKFQEEQVKKEKSKNKPLSGADMIEKLRVQKESAKLGESVELDVDEMMKEEDAKAQALAEAMESGKEAVRQETSSETLDRIIEEHIKPAMEELNMPSVSEARNRFEEILSGKGSGLDKNVVMEALDKMEKEEKQSL